MNERALIGLLSPDPNSRLAAIRATPRTADGAFALRDALLLDSDANVRALAAEVMASMPLPRAAHWLVEALADASPEVRDASLRAIARAKHRAASPDVARLCLNEPVWWVRRTAVLTLVSLTSGDPCAKERAIETLCDVLDDPFWRVRYPAILALASIGDDHPEFRQRILEERAGIAAAGISARIFLRSRWFPSARVDAGIEPADRPDDGLWNPDPAVITARLEGPLADSVEPARLLEFLLDPHERLRKLASKILKARGDDDAIASATAFLDQARIPYASETASDLLESLRSRAEPAALSALRRGGPGAVEWAARFAIARGSDALIEPLWARAGDKDARVQSAVVAALGALGEDVRPSLEDDHAAVRRAAVLAIVGAGDIDGALANVAFSAQDAIARRALTEHAARTRDTQRLRAASNDEDDLVRARAVAARRALLDIADTERAQLLSDEDPWIRAAAIDLATATTMIQRDPSPSVRRAALNILASSRESVPVDDRTSVFEIISDGLDPWLKIRSLSLVSANENRRSLLALLRLFRDDDAEVRAAAEEALSATDLNTGALIEIAIAETADVKAKLAAWPLLLRDADEASRSLRASALRDAATPREVRELLVAMGPIFGENPAISVASDPPRATDASATRAPRSHNAALSKLAISGVFELHERDYDRALDAGARLFFWEPGYRSLQTFLRERRNRTTAAVITGSYEGSPRSIRRDIDRIRRSLRRDTLDVFLLFWTRSPERLSPEVIATLADLRREGAIKQAGFSTHHRDLAKDAILRGGIDIVMTRHSAAHPGAERDLFPAAIKKGVPIITFSALSYGRLLRRAPGASRGHAPSALPFTAADCYRYSMKQPGVASTVAAPRTAAELDHDLNALLNPTLDAETERALLAHGERVRAASRFFNDLVRMPRSGALWPESAPPEILLEEAWSEEPRAAGGAR